MLSLAPGGGEKPADDGSRHQPPAWAPRVAVAAGICFMVALLVIALFIPHPTSFQIFVFRVVLALAGAGFAVALTGFITVNMPLWGKGAVMAGGGLAVFVIIYRLNPPALLLGGDPNLIDVPTMQPIGALVANSWGETRPKVTLTDESLELQNFKFPALSGAKHELVGQWCAASPCLLCDPSSVTSSTPEVRVSLRAPVVREPHSGNWPPNREVDGKLVLNKPYELIDTTGQRYVFACAPAAASAPPRPPPTRNSSALPPT